MSQCCLSVSKITRCRWLLKSVSRGSNGLSRNVKGISRAFGEQPKHHPRPFNFPIKICCLKLTFKKDPNGCDECTALMSRLGLI